MSDESEVGRTHVFDTIHFQPIRWESPDGLMHACDGAHIGNTPDRLIWTKCGRYDVPANASWLGTDKVTCCGCDHDYEPSETQQGLIPIPDGYSEQ